jgi:hypothetical protein
MSRSAYAIALPLLVLAVPLVTAVPISFAFAARNNLINIPNREVWLSDEHREATLSFLRVHLRVMGVVVAIFLVYMHTLIVRANRLDPPLLPASDAVVGLVVFGCVVAVWIVVLYRRFSARA